MNAAFCKLSCFALIAVVLFVPRLVLAGPVEHLVLLRFKDGAPRGEVQRALEEFERLPSKIPGILAFRWGLNSSPEGLSKGFTHGFVITFEGTPARDAYITHAAHQAFVAVLRPLLEDVFVLDFEVEAAPPVAEPGRVHHLVFFKFKASASKEEIGAANAAFSVLPKKIPGLVHYRAGANTSPEGAAKGFTHGYLLTFLTDRARDDYLIHPAHTDLVSLLGPILEEPLVVDFTIAPSARSLFVLDGIEPYQVHQRDSSGTADLDISGVSRDDGPIEVRLRSGRRTVPGFDWKAAGKAEGGVFHAVLENVPAGGEYTVEIRRRDALGAVADHTEVANLLVGDIWILAGQSNMEGVGDLTDLEEPSPLVHCFTMAHRWELAVEPLHWLIDSPDPVHSGDALKDLDEEGRRARRAERRGGRTKGAGLGLPFARELVRRTGVPIGLIAAAHGGTSMEQWSPSGRERGGASLYGSLLKQVKNAGGRVKGVLWYQGESDANPNAAALFASRFKELVAAFRSDLKSPDLPFYYVQIGRFVLDVPPASWNQIQELQRLSEKEIPGTAMVPVIDLPLDDLIHVGTDGLKRTGRRLARIAHREVFGAKQIARGPRLASVELDPAGKTLRVKYSDVNGRLLPARRVEGYSLRTPEGKELKLIYDASVDPAAPDTVVLRLQSPPPPGALLHYGLGLDPFANLVDLEDMAAPVFGPFPVRK